MAVNRRIPSQADLSAGIEARISRAIYSEAVRTRRIDRGSAVNSARDPRARDRAIGRSA